MDPPIKVDNKSGGKNVKVNEKAVKEELAEEFQASENFMRKS
jgi:hypothetical protein